MAFTVAKGTITVPGSTGALAKIPATNPKVVKLWGTRQTAAGTSATDLQFGMGFGTYRGAAVQQCYSCIAGDENVSDMVYSDGAASDALLRGLTTAGAVDWEIDLVDMVSDGVNLTVVDAPATANIVLHYEIYGGDDLSDAEAKLFALSTAAATQDVPLSSGMGNPGDGTGWLSFFAKAQRTAAGQGRSDWGLCLGVDDGTDSFACLFGGEDTTASAALGHWQKTGRSILGFTAATGTADCEANIDSSGHPADGFQLAFADQATIACQVASVHMRGDFGATIFESATPTATGNLDIAASFSETIRGTFLFGGNVNQKTTIDTTHASLGGIWAGGSDFTNEGGAGFHENDALGFCDIVMWHGVTKALEVRHTSGAENSDALLADADASVSGSNLRLNFTTVNATARGFGGVILGDAPAGGGAPAPRHLGLLGVGT